MKPDPASNFYLGEELPVFELTPEQDARLQEWWRDHQMGFTELPMWVQDGGRAPPSARDGHKQAGDRGL